MLLVASTYSSSTLNSRGLPEVFMPHPSGGSVGNGLRILRILPAWVLGVESAEVLHLFAH